MIGSFALTEPGAGSDAASLKTRAVRRGDHYVLDGAKQFISSASIAGVVIVFAVTDPAAGKRGISAFLVPTDSKGFRVSRIEEKLGQKASDTCALAFDGLEVPVENRLGEEGEGLRIALSSLEQGRIGIAAQSVGMATAALDYAIGYARSASSSAARSSSIRRWVPAGRPRHPTGGRPPARAARGPAARCRSPCLKEACMAKLFASETAEAICSGALQTLGGYGYLRDYPVERIYRDVRVCQIYEGYVGRAEAVDRATTVELRYDPDRAGGDSR